MQRLTLFLVCLVALVPLLAQRTAPRFRHLSINDGLTQNRVKVIYQDRDGFMWLGTKDGLNRYDGYTFVHYLSDIFDERTIDNNNILSLLEDSSGRLWIGTSTGLNYLDRATGRVIRVPLFKPVPIATIAEWPRGTICAGSQGDGIFIIDPLRIHEPAYRPDHIVTSLSSGWLSIKDLYADSTILWAGTEGGLLCIDTALQIIKSIEIYVRAPEAMSTSVDSAITRILDDGKGHLWLGSSSGLIRFSKRSQSYEAFHHHYAVYRYNWGTITSILHEEGTPYLWLGALDELMIFDTLTKSYTYYRHSPTDIYGISGAGVLSLHQDNSGLIWAGTNGNGISIHDPVKQGFHTFIRTAPPNSRIADFSIRTIFEDQAGNIWIGARVLYRLDRASGKLTSFERSSAETQAFGNTGITSIIEDRSGWLWISSYEGLSRYHVRDSIIHHYHYNGTSGSTYPEKLVLLVFEDRAGQIWTITPQHISLFDKESGTFDRTLLFEHEVYERLYFPRIYEDKDGIFWINSDYGLIRFDPVSKAKQFFTADPKNPKSIRSSLVRSVCPDPDHPEKYLWLATAGGGLNKFDLETGTCDHITTEQGLPDNVIYGVLPDEKGRLWMSTNKGISMYDIYSGHIKTYDVADGLQSNEFNSGAYFKSRTGEMFFGGIEGLSFFFPEAIRENTRIPKVVITSVKYGRDALNAEKQLNNTSLWTTGTSLRIPFKSGIVSFEYTALDYSAPAKNQYRYRLSGWDPDWIHAAGRRVATYSNLPPGNYTFQVIGSNNDDHWNLQGASVQFVISPPWFRSKIAWIVYFLCGAGGIFGIYRYRIQQMRLRHQLQLEHITTSHLRELDKMKTQFFTNISHEFRTPLTLIQGPVQILKAEVTDERSRKLLNVVEQNAQRLLQLINEILELAKLDSGAMKVAQQTGDVVTFLRDLTILHDSMATYQGKTLSFTSSISSWQCRFDSAKMERILSNLISNALKFTDKGDSIAVHIEINRYTNETDSLVITVHDTGTGISQETLPKIFTRFFQGDTFSGQGTGIGLALVKELTGLLGGTIEVSSISGEYTEFRVVIPVGTAEDTQEQIVASAATHSRSAPEPLIPAIHDNLTGSVMLVVEDNEDIRALIVSMFSDRYRILEAGDGATGLELATEQVPDIIITDLMMPVMNGIALCKALRASDATNHIPIVMLTARADTETVIEGYDTGADAYVVKPFHGEVLVSQVNSLVHTRQILQKKYAAQFFQDTSSELTSLDTLWCQGLKQVLSAELSNEHFGVDELSAAMHLSKRQLQRKCNALLGVTPNEFIRNFRLEHARLMLEAGAGSVSEICYAVGFNNLSYFSKCFKDYHHRLPSEMNAKTRIDSGSIFGRS